MSHLVQRVAICIAALAVVACAKLEDRARGYLASTVDVFAVLDGQLLRGEAQLDGDRSGTMSVSTGLANAPALRCSGRLSRTGTTAATLQLHCNNGSSLSMSAAMLAETQGYAYGQGSNGQTASLTLGLAPDRAVSYLRPPAGQQLVVLPKKPFIELR
jgi:hypothetical protein